MVESDLWWIGFTVLAAAGQTARNAMQRGLTRTLGTAGATHVRFLYGLPFSLVFLTIALLVFQGALPPFSVTFLTWAAAAAVAQIFATALLLMAMQARSFVVSVAYSKTEPVQVAVFATLFLGDHLTPVAIAAVMIATFGVLVMSWRPGAASEGDIWRPALLGVGSGALFALAAVGFRGAIQTLQHPNFVIAASTTLVVGLAIQSALLTLWLLVSNRAALVALLREWRPSILAGFLGAAASQMWFLAFALETAARVRTVGLVEILFAQIVSMQIIKEGTRWQDLAGMAMVVFGVVLILLGY
jgi:drug/metabolite transporter (DMT)-like permease